MLLYIVFIAVFIGILLLISTRVRKAASAAFEPEAIDKKHFKIFKPEGYLTPIDEASDYPFEAFTREVGERKAGRLRKSMVKMEIYDGLQFEEIREQTRKKFPEILSETIYDGVPEGQQICLIEAREPENDEDSVNKLFFHKIIESKPNGKTYDLEIMVLEAHIEEFEARKDRLIESFQVK